MELGYAIVERLPEFPVSECKEGFASICEYPESRHTHMSGSAIDISVFHPDGAEAWRGGSYIDVSESTPMRSPFISESELQNRIRITEVMESHGFMHFSFEFRNYNKGDASAHIVTDNPAPAGYNGAL